MSFASRIKQLASETAIYGISTMVGRLINFLLVPLYIGFFPPDRYGVVGLLYGTFMFLNIAYQYGMESAYLKYASGSEGRASASKTFSTATWSLAATALLFSALVVVGRDVVAGWIRIETQWSHLLFLAAGILSLDALTILPFAELRLQNKPIRFAAIKLANILINVGLNLWLIVGWRMGIEAIFIANLAASAVSFLLLLPLYGRLLRWSFEPGLCNALLVFGLPFVPSGLSYALVDRANLFFLGRMTPERVVELYGDSIDVATLTQASQAGGDAVFAQHVVGVFNACWKLGVFMMLLAQMFRFAWQPFFLQHAEDDDAKPLFARVFLVLSAASLGVFLTVSFFAQELAALPVPGGGFLIPQAYWLGLYLVPIALVAYVFQGWYYAFSAGAYIEKKTKLFAYCTGAGAAVSLAMNLTLVPYFGMTAAAWATTLPYAIMAISLYAAVQRTYPVPYNWSKVLLLGGLTALIFGAWYRLPALQLWMWELGLLAVYVAGLFALRVVSPSAVRQLLRG